MRDPLLLSSVTYPQLLLSPWHLSVPHFLCRQSLAASLAHAIHPASTYIIKQTVKTYADVAGIHASTQDQQLLVTSHDNQKIVLLARHVSIQETAPTHNPVIALHSYISSTPWHSDIQMLIRGLIPTPVTDLLFDIYKRLRKEVGENINHQDSPIP